MCGRERVKRHMLCCAVQRCTALGKMDCKSSSPTCASTSSLASSLATRVTVSHRCCWSLSCQTPRRPGACGSCSPRRPGAGRSSQSGRKRRACSSFQACIRAHGARVGPGQLQRDRGRACVCPRVLVATTSRPSSPGVDGRVVDGVVRVVPNEVLPRRERPRAAHQAIATLQPRLG